MWTRAELKNKAKFSFKRNYWKSVLISLLLALLVSGGSGAGSASSAFSSGFGDSGNVTFDTSNDYYDDDYGFDEDDIFNELNRVDNDTDHMAMLFAGIIFAVVFVVVFLVIMTVVVLLDVFIFNPLEVGCKRFYVRNLNEAAQIGNVGFAFDNNYKNIAKTMFFRDLYTILWSLLFVIPGIVKSYEYQMIPYLLAENPQMTKEQAFAESKRMMDGQKWNAFVLDLSFIGWDILSAMTLGILGIFYVQPYMDATHAALYEALRYGIPYDTAGDEAVHGSEGFDNQMPGYNVTDNQRNMETDNSNNNQNNYQE